MARAVVLIATAFLLFTAAAWAAPVDDVRALGYTVTPYPANVGGYRVVGYGVDSYFTDADLVALLNAPGQCNRAWQYDHPDQLAAFDTLGRKGYGVSGDQCADRYVVANSFTAAVIYTGPGAGLVQLAVTAPVVVAAPAQPGEPVPAPVTQTCLPLCLTPGPVINPPPPPVVPGQTVTLTNVAAQSKVAVQTAVAPATLNPLLASVVSDKLNTPITITKSTACYLAGVKTPCVKLYGALRKSSRHVTVRAKGTTATRITVA